MSHSESWERDPAGLVVCMTLERISSPFGGPIPEARVVELKFSLSPCHGLQGGELMLRIPVAEAQQYMLGSEFSIRVREM